MATHTHSDNDAASKSDDFIPPYWRWVYDEQFGAILHEDDCRDCEDWKEHYKLSQDKGCASMHEACQAHHIAVWCSFELRVDSLEWEHSEMLQEVAVLQQELEQVQMEIEKVQKDQVRIINSNLEWKCWLVEDLEDMHHSPLWRGDSSLTLAT